MNAVAGVAALVIALVGCVVLTEKPTRAQHVELIESGGQIDEMPLYIHFDQDDFLARMITAGRVPATRPDS